MSVPSTFMPRAGDIWIAYLDPVVGSEQRGNRPVLIISAYWFNNATGGNLVLAVPVTSSGKKYQTHIAIPASEANLDRDSWAMCEQVRTLSAARFKRKRGEISGTTLQAIRETINALLTD
jgi:mRNA interferase MazF